MDCTVTSKRLREALDDNNMKPQDLANLTGINKSSISQYKNGSHAPSNISAGKMAEVLNVNPCWLMGFDVPKHQSLIPSDGNISQREKNLIDMYRYIDEDAKERIERSLTTEYEQERKKRTDALGREA